MILETLHLDFYPMVVIYVHHYRAPNLPANHSNGVLRLPLPLAPPLPSDDNGLADTNDSFLSFEASDADHIQM